MKLMRRLLQGYLNLKAANEPRRSFISAAPGGHIRTRTRRQLTCLFGDVIVSRKGYRQPEQAIQFPLDAELNLAVDQYSDGIRYRTVQEAIRNSYDNAVEAIGKTTGGHVPKRQALNLVQDVSQDFEAYYRQERFSAPEDTQDLLVLSFDGKGIVMRTEGRLPALTRPRDGEDGILARQFLQNWLKRKWNYRSAIIRPKSNMQLQLSYYPMGPAQHR